MTGEATWSWQGSLNWNFSPISLPEGTGPIDITSLGRQWGARGFRLITGDTTGHASEANVPLVCLLRAVTGPYLGSLCSCQNMGSSWEYLQLGRLRGAGLLCMLAQALWPQESILPWAADCPSSGSRTEDGDGQDLGWPDSGHLAGRFNPGTCRTHCKWFWRVLCSLLLTALTLHVLPKDVCSSFFFFLIKNVCSLLRPGTAADWQSTFNTYPPLLNIISDLDDLLGVWSQLRLIPLVSDLVPFLPKKLLWVEVTNSI